MNNAIWARSIWKAPAALSILIGAISLTVIDDPLDGFYYLGAIAIVVTITIAVIQLARTPLSIWWILFWKEWREHRWKLAALLAVVVGLHVWVLDATEPDSSHYAMPFLATMSLVLPIGSLFVGAGLGASERAHRTASFLKTIPIDSRLVALTKLVVGILTVWLSAVAAVFLTAAVLWWGEHLGWPTIESSTSILERIVRTSGWVPGVLAVSLSIAASIVIWVAALGVNAESEVRAGAIGLVAFVVGWALFLWIVLLIREDYGNRDFYELFLSHLSAVLPGGLLFGFQTSRGLESASVLGLSLLTHALLGFWYVTRYGKESRIGDWSLSDTVPGGQRADTFLTAPRRSPLTALVWKQVRQGLPVVAAGFVGATLVSLTLFLANLPPQPIADLKSSPELASGTVAENLKFSLEVASGAVAGAFLVLGCCVGFVSGVGSMTAEFEPRLMTFWRSRPISIDLWFAIAFGSGILMLLLIFGGPILLGERLVAILSRNEGFPFPLMATLLLSYVVGVLTSSFVRHAAYASLLSIGVFGAVLWVANSERIVETKLGAGMVIAVACVIMTLTAWQAVRRDWAILR